MRYAQIRNADILNGTGIGCTLFVQGCPFYCKGCFNSIAQNFNGAKNGHKKWKTLLVNNKPYIQKVTILYHEPL